MPRSGNEVNGTVSRRCEGRDALDGVKMVRAASRCSTPSAYCACCACCYFYCRLASLLCAHPVVWVGLEPPRHGGLTQWQVLEHGKDAATRDLLGRPQRDLTAAKRKQAPFQPSRKRPDV